MAVILCLLYSSTVYGQQKLVLAKLKGLSDQYLGEYILNEAYDKLGIDLTFQVLPAKRALMHSRGGFIDGEIQRISIIEESSPTLIRVPTPISYVDLCVFLRKKIPFRSLKEMGDYKFVYVRGVKIYETLLKYFKSSHAVMTDEVMWRLIIMKRMDIAVAGRVSTLYKFKTLGIEGIYPLDPPLQTLPLYHYLHEKHRDLVPKIDNVLQKLTQSGEIKRLRAQAVENLLRRSQK